MTTKITVYAHAGWPVKVTTIHPQTGERSIPQVVEKGEERDFYVHMSQDLLVHEVPPDEVDRDAAEREGTQAEDQPTEL